MKSRLPEGALKPKSMDGIIKEAQKMQEKMEEVKQQVNQMEFAATAGGVVEAVANGSRELARITISPQVLDPNDLDMLQDLIVVAVNESLKKAADCYDEQINKITGGLNIPGLD